MLAVLSGGTNIKATSPAGSLKRKREQPDFQVTDVKDSCSDIRRKLKISVTGELDETCPPMTSFADQVDAVILRNLQKFGYVHPTAIQAQAIPLLQAKHDILACAPTGSGKTLAYVLPILAALKKHKEIGYRALVVSPTRELATQIFNQFRKMTEKTPYKVNLLTKSNATIQAEHQELAKKYDVLVTTPQRLINSITDGTINLSEVKMLILDEADRLFEDGFIEQTDEILAACTYKKMRKALFSATLPSGVEQLAKTVMNKPVRIIVGHKDTATDLIEQELVFVGDEAGKLVAIRQLARRGALRPPVLIFVQNIERAEELHTELTESGMNVDVIHADRSQGQRDQSISKFREGTTWMLITTELLSRGIDFQGVSLVINYDFPQSLQSYIHRIGRTGRAGSSGKAITFFAKEDVTYLKTVASTIKASGGEVPAWMLELKAPSKNEKKQLKRKPLQRKSILAKSKHDIQKEAHKKDMIKASIIKRNASKKELSK